MSGSRVPAEAGELVAMLVGSPDTIEEIRAPLAPMCWDVVDCGPVPNRLLMKLAVSISLTTVVTGLAETVQFARAYGLDLGLLVDILGAGQLASPILRVKAPNWSRRISPRRRRSSTSWRTPVEDSDLPPGCGPCTRKYRNLAPGCV